MKSSLFILLGLCLPLGLLSAAVEPPPVPETGTVARFGPTVAEGARIRVPIKDDAAAITGRYAAADRDWLVVAQAPIPAEGDQFHIWIRYRGLALQMKTRLSGQTELTEFPWNWARHLDGFAWRHVGVFDRAELGPEVFFMTDPKHNATSGVDAVVITTDRRWAPPRR